MSDRCIPEKIRDFLIQRPSRPYCDACIQERLGLKWRQQVQLVTATLAVTNLFRRERDECCTCHEEKYVISAVGSPRPRDLSASGRTKKIGLAKAQPTDGGIELTAPFSPAFNPT
jgi:hypothetical protein